MSKQTAVEWLIQQIVDRQNGNADSRSVDEIFNQAKAMEREQIIEAFDKAYPYDIIGYDAAEQYYNDTYKGGEQ